MLISIREKSIIENWFGDQFETVIFMAKISKIVDEDSTIATAYQIIWNAITPTFNDRQLSRFEAVLLWAGAMLDPQGSQTDYCLDFLEAREENELPD